MKVGAILFMDEAINKVKNFIDFLKIDKIMKRVIFADGEMREFIISLNQEQLYDSGRDSKGEELGYPGYAQYTMYIKEEKGQRYDHVTLKDHGYFYDSFYVKWTSTGIEIWAEDEKTEDLVLRYGEDIFGLDLLSMEELRVKLIDTINRVIREKI